MKVKLRDILTPVSHAEPVESEKKYRILGVKWYAKGAWVKDEKYGADIKANSVYRVQEGDLIYNRLFAWKGSFAVISKDLDGSYVSNEFPALRCNEKMAYLDYVFLFLSQYDVWAAIDKLSTGVASISRKRLKVQELLNIEILLPPKNIQQKIINKYSQIDNFYSQLIKLQDKNAVFVKKLRQAILQLAVQGKLAPQDPNDEPAGELLKRIKAEKEKLIAEGNIKKQKPLPPITEDEIPYELPQGWEWVRLGNLTQVITKGSSPKWQGVQYVGSDEGLLFLTSKNVGNYNLILDNSSFVEWKFNEIEPRSILQNGDILMNIVGASIGRTALYDLNEIANINQAVCLIRFLFFFDKRYFLHFFNSPVCISYMFDKQVDMARPNLSMGNIGRFLVPVPPVAEQKRIVAKVDQLMHFCNELENRLNQSKKDSEMLMQAVLHEAFS